MKTRLSARLAVATPLVAALVLVSPLATGDGISPSVVVRPIRVVSAAIEGKPPFNGGGMRLRVLLKSDATTPILTTLSFGRLGPHGTTTTESSSGLVSPGTLHVRAFEIPEVACHPETYTAQLTQPTASVDTGTREIAIVPKCSFTTSIADPWSLLTPDRVEAAKANIAYLNDVVITEAYACQKTFEVRGRARNASSVPITVRLQLARSGLPPATSQPITIAPGGGADMFVRVAANGLDRGFDAALVTEGGGKLAPHSVRINVAKSCSSIDVSIR